MGEAVPPSQLLGDPDCVLRGQEELPTPGHPGGHRGDHWLRVEAAKETHVREVEVAVSMAVGIGEVGAAASHGEDRTMGIQIMEPAHGDAVRHRVSSAGVEGQGLGTRLDKAPIFAFSQGGDASGVHCNSSLVLTRAGHA